MARDAAKSVELQSLGSELNTALARVAAEERRRAEHDATASSGETECEGEPSLPELPPISLPRHLEHLALASGRACLGLAHALSAAGGAARRAPAPRRRGALAALCLLRAAACALLAHALDRAALAAVVAPQPPGGVNSNNDGSDPTPMHEATKENLLALIAESDDD